MKTIISTLQVIFKVVEKCNLNCSYCYYYTEANVNSNLRPTAISKGDVSAVVQFLQRACEDYQINNLSIIFHGGEPTLLKPSLADWVLQSFQDNLGHVTKLAFSLQTNGLHLSDAWLQLIEKYKIGVGVSIDGNQRFNDIYRLDHKSNGSHERIVATIKRLEKESIEKRINPVGTITVLNHGFDYNEIYNHLVNELNVTYMTFLLPDASWDRPPENIGRYGEILCELFDQWLEGDQEVIRVRQFAELLQHFKTRLVRMESSANYMANQIIVIHSDGHIAIDDTFMPALEWYKGLETSHVGQTELKDWLGQDVFQEIRRARATVPEECRGCRWAGICRGGDIENRFSRDSGFQRKSVYCEALMRLYDHVADVLLSGGYSRMQLDRAIKHAKNHALNG